MNPLLKVFLIGLPGSGKTTLARQVGEQLNIPSFDLDDEIEKASRKKVTDIFLLGENEFRRIESETLKSIISKNDSFILATGGGAPCFNNNLDLMKQSGTVIFLDVPVEEIVKRVSVQAIDRPLLKGDVQQKIETLLEKRISIYNQSHYKIEGNSISLHDVISILSK